MSRAPFLRILTCIAVAVGAGRGDLAVDAPPGEPILPVRRPAPKQALWRLLSRRRDQAMTKLIARSAAYVS